MHDAITQDGAVLRTELLRNDKLLRSLAAELTGRAADAEDLVQDTWLLALRRAPRLDGRALSAWLATALKRSAGRQRTRDRQRRERERDAADRDAGRDEIARVEERIDAQILLLEAVRRLPEPERECVLLRYESELSPPEVAAQLACPLNTVKGRLKRGLAHLRDDVDRRAQGGLRGWSAALGGVAVDALRTASPAGPGSGVKWLGAAAVLAVGAVGAFEIGSRRSASVQNSVARSADLSAIDSDLSGPVADSVQGRTSLGPLARTRPQEKAATHATPVEPPFATLDVTLEGMTDADPARITIRVRPDGDPFPAEDFVEARQSFDTTVGHDVSRLFGDPADTAALRSASIVVTAMHPRGSRAIEVVALPGTVERGSRFEVTMTMHPARCLSGVVLDELGDPISNAFVAVFPVDGEGAPLPQAVAPARSGPDGTFEITSPDRGPWALVALFKGKRPATSLVHEGPRDSNDGTLGVDAGVLQFTEGYSIDGRLVSRGAATAVPTSLGALIQSSSATSPSPAFYDVSWFYGDGAGTLIWRDRRFEYLGLMADVEADGEFTLEGLAPSEYELHVHGFSNSHPRVTKPVKTLVTAPRSGVLIEVPYVLVDLAFEDLGAARNTDHQGGVLHLEREGHATETTEIYGGELTSGQHRTFTFDPGERVVFRAEMPGRIPAEVTIDLPARGGSVSRVLRLEPDPNTSSLSLRPEGVELQEGTTVQVHIYPEGTSTEALRWAGLRHDARVRTVTLTNGVLRLDGLPAGGLDIVAYAGAHVAQRASLLLDARVAVVLAAGEDREVPLLFEPGGRLRVTATNGRGEYVGLQATVLDSTGAVLPVTFVAYAPSGGGSSTHSHLGSEGPNVVVPNLAAGEYTLRFALPSGETLERTAVVEPGEVCDVTVSID